MAGSIVSDFVVSDSLVSDSVVSGSLASDAALLAAGRSVRFARACNPGRQILPLRSTALALSDHLLIDPTAQAHLELVRSASDPSGPTLLQALDLTCTVGGSRLLRRRLCSPLKDVAQIRPKFKDRVSFARVNGKPAISLNVSKRTNATGKNRKKFQ